MDAPDELESLIGLSRLMGDSGFSESEAGTGLSTKTFCSAEGLVIRRTGAGAGRRLTASSITGFGEKFRE